MATIVLSAAGAAMGASLGGGVLGVSSAVIGRAIGASLGRAVDQRLIGAGSEAVETGRVDRFRLTSASEGAAISQVHGRVRIAGQVIWATRFLEHVEKSGGSGKGMTRTPSSTQYAYSVSLAVALCEGEISRIARIWADGQEIARGGLNICVYKGDEKQLPDPKIEAVEGAGNAPAYRGIAYVVVEDLDLAPYGNRVPQFTFEVVRTDPESGADLSGLIDAVAMIPGTGEYALATTPVYLDDGQGGVTPTNIHSASGKTDFATALDDLSGELPNCGSTSLVVSWFGDDLRCGTCRIAPKVEQNEVDGGAMPWRVSGLTRETAGLVPRDPDDRVVYGGTPSDASVLEAIAGLKAAGQAVMFYPFILMEQMAGNTLTDPWTGAAGQAVLPWRGRITTSLAPGVAGTPDRTAAADAEVAAFFGQAAVGDFEIGGDTVSYTGPEEYSLRRMVLHYAHLCALAGGVDAFCIGSELRGITQIRGADGFPAVAALVELAADVRAILGPNCKISYAADWSEYFGYQADGNLYYHLDPLWADENIDFVGIDNYMPLSDWREGDDHTDAPYGSIYDLDYLKSNIEGGEGYDWYYAYEEHREAQIRSPIEDGAHDEPWVWRFKDIRNWWAQPHHERIDGVRQADPTGWLPKSKPVWFTELGCAAIDKGTNEPNKFLDPKSSESTLPRYSTGRRDDFIQIQYLRAMREYWHDPDNNPVSEVYGNRMIDMTRAHVWAWDARPYPTFPALSSIWADGDNYLKGHWLNGRSASRTLASVVEDICARAGVRDVDTSALWGVVRGYQLDALTSARSALQPLLLAFGVEVIERDGRLIFRNRTGRVDGDVSQSALVQMSHDDSALELTRAPEAELAGRVRLTFVDADHEYAVRVEEALLPGDDQRVVSHSEFPLVLTRSEARQTVERWLAEARVARDTARFALPPSRFDLGAGDVIALETASGIERYRIDHASLGAQREIEAVRVEQEVYTPSDEVEEAVVARAFTPPVPVLPIFMDLPLMDGESTAHAPYLATTARPWPGSVAVYSAPDDAGYEINTIIPTWSIVGVTQTALDPATAGLWDRGPALRVKLTRGTLSAATVDQVLNGANLACVGDGSAANWEVFQFASATLVGDRTYDISMRLRGQAGTDSLEGRWPAGSRFVLLDGRPKQISLSAEARGLSRHYRVGPAARPFDDPVYKHLQLAFDGNGLRPYAPGHLRASYTDQGDLYVRWVRRTRIDGDTWQSAEVPLGEAREAYMVRVLQRGQVVRETQVGAPEWTYPSALKALDGIGADFRIEVAQMSDSFGPGLFRGMDIHE